MGLCLAIIACVKVYHVWALDRSYGLFTYLAVTYSSLTAVYLFGRIIGSMLYRELPMDPRYFPSITVVTASLNGGACVRDAIGRLFGTGYPLDRLHVIAVNDGSTDGGETLRAMRDAAAAHPLHVTVIDFPVNSGKRVGMYAGVVLGEALHALRMAPEWSPSLLADAVGAVADRAGRDLSPCIAEAIRDGLQSEIGKLIELGGPEAARTLKATWQAAASPEGPPVPSSPADARGTEEHIVVFVDDDSYLRTDALRHMVQPFVEPDVGAVCGHANANNVTNGRLSAMQGLLYLAAFRVVKGAESVTGSVTCCSGCLAAYRGSILLDVLGTFARQRFLGQPTTFGDDRNLTNLVLRSGRRVVYARAAVVDTDVPERCAQYCRQQMRWKKSWFRETLVANKTLWKHPFANAWLYYMGIMLQMLSPIVVGYHLLYRPLFLGQAPILYVLGLCLLPLLLGLFYIHANQNSMDVFRAGLLPLLFKTLLFGFLTYVAIGKSRDVGWGTRSAAGSPNVPDPLPGAAGTGFSGRTQRLRQLAGRVAAWMRTLASSLAAILFQILFGLSASALLTLSILLLAIPLAILVQMYRLLARGGCFLARRACVLERPTPAWLEASAEVGFRIVDRMVEGTAQLIQAMVWPLLLPMAMFAPPVPGQQPPEVATGEAD